METPCNPPSFSTRSRRWRWSCAKCRCPRSAPTDVLLQGRRRVGLRLRRAPGLRDALVAGEHPGDARPRVRRHHRRVGARGHRLQGRRPRRQRDGRRHLRHVPDVPHRPLQPVPDAQGLRLRRQRRDGRVREGAGALPAPRARHAAVRAGVPHRAALRRLQLDVRQRRPSSRATASWCSGPGPIGLLCARMAALSGANPLIVAGLVGRRRAPRDGARAGRDAHRQHPGRVARRGRARPRAARRRCRVRRVRREPPARRRA